MGQRPKRSGPRDGQKSSTQPIQKDSARSYWAIFAAVIAMLIFVVTSSFGKVPNPDLPKRAWDSNLTMRWVSKEPRVAIIDHFLSSKEVSEILGLLDKAREVRTASPGPSVGADTNRYKDVLPVAHPSAAELIGASPAMQKIDERLSQVTGLPTAHVEGGYFSIYEAGFNMTGLHLDNHHSGMTPKRAASAVIYLTDVESSGYTVFPLAKGKFTHLTSKEEAEREPIVNFWREAFNQSLDAGEHIRPQEGPQALRGVNKGKLFEEAQRMCARSYVPSAAAQGSALIFFSLTSDGLEDLRAMHGSCSVRHGRKIVLAKFIRTGPKPHYLITDGKRVISK